MVTLTVEELSLEAGQRWLGGLGAGIVGGLGGVGSASALEAGFGLAFCTTPFGLLALGVLGAGAGIAAFYNW